MAFLDNSGDIILDAVLTDAGRQRLSRGNFKITKFAFGDEEINYNVFNGSHPSGSAFYDLEIMQTPILEAFTNNTSLMKSKLITMTRNNILYMPIFKLNNIDNNRTETVAGLGGSDPLNFGNGYVVLADKNTEQDSGGIDKPLKAGLIRGAGTRLSGQDDTNHIAVDQGIDSTEGGLSFRQPLPADLVETAFLIKVDHRLLTLAQIGGEAGNRAPVALSNQFVDDDGIATYYVVQGDGTTCVEGPPAGVNNPVISDQRRRDIIVNDNPDSTEQAKTFTDFNERFPGPLGSILRIIPRTSMHVRQSDALFDEFGSASTTSVTISKDSSLAFSSWKYIDTLINIVGVTTGYSFDIPIRIVKKS
jgi:hypothetical protein